MRTFPQPVDETLEMDAMSAALRAADKRGDSERARTLTELALGHRGEAESTEDFVITTAMKKIAGQRLVAKTRKPCGRKWEDRLASTISLAWVDWLTGNSHRGAHRLEHVMRQRKQHENEKGNSAVNLMALNFWCEAVLDLTRKNYTNACRLFRRAIDLGGQMGTSSHPMISWAYAATYLAGPISNKQPSEITPENSSGAVKNPPSRVS